MEESPRGESVGTPESAKPRGTRWEGRAVREGEDAGCIRVNSPRKAPRSGEGL